MKVYFGPADISDKLTVSYLIKSNVFIWNVYTPYTCIYRWKAM